MTAPTTAGPCWSTASFGAPVSTTATELSELAQHLKRCRQLSGRWLIVRCGVEAIHRFMAARLVTTLVLIALLGGTSLLVS